MKLICFGCEKEIADLDYKMAALDSPYINLYFHKGCYNSLESSINEYIDSNKEKFAVFMSNFRKKQV